MESNNLFYTNIYLFDKGIDGDESEILELHFYERDSCWMLDRLKCCGAVCNCNTLLKQALFVVMLEHTYCVCVYVLMKYRVGATNHNEMCEKSIKLFGACALEKSTVNKISLCTKIFLIDTAAILNIEIKRI